MAKQKSYQEATSPEDKKHFAKYLAEDEELVMATGYSKNYLRHQFVLYIVLPGALFWILGVAVSYFISASLATGLLIGLIVSLIFAYLKTLLLYHSHRYLLTTRRVIIKNGFFAVKLTTALFDKITHIEVDQTFLDRAVMKHGNIIINTAGGNKDEIELTNVDSPIEFKNLLERLINREREQFGRPTGPVVTLEGELID